jgi:CRISPR-associated endonuclease/helicase Cas3
MFFSHVEMKDNIVIEERSIPLKDHLKEVADRAKKYFFFNSEENISDVAYYIGLTHDFGKYMTYFQDRLLGKGDYGKLSNHAFISSLYSAFVMEGVKLDNISEEIKPFLPLITFFVVYHHHLDLTSLSHLEDHLNDEDYIDILKKQIDNIKTNEEEIDRELEELDLLRIDEFGKDFNNLIERLLKIKYRFEKKANPDIKAKVSILILSLFSALIDADKKSAGKVRDIERRVIPSDIVEIYKKNFIDRTDRINLIREEIFNKVIQKIDTIDIKKNRIFTFTSPTGSGKTLTGFAFALKLRKKIEEKVGYTPRLIYSLPFISIINQNYEVLKDVLSNIKEFAGNSSAYLIGHHHSAKVEYEEYDEVKDTETSLALLESWESEVIVTTFVQLLHSTIAFKNSFLKKYHNIARSIIILDEVQNIPVEYWSLVNNILKLMTEYLGCYIILMTATKPLIFDQDKSLELLDGSENYFKEMDRLELNSQVVEEKTLEDLFSWFNNNYESNRSYLIVFNTIKSSIEFYNRLKSALGEKTKLYYLSANIVSKERLKRIQEIKSLLKEGYKPILVSTQVIEAGVDIDFDVVIRDIGPLDSVIQVSGRCNRNFRKNNGSVWVFYLVDERGRDYATYVYKKISPSLAREILRGIERIREAEFIDLINIYFKKLKNRESFQDSEEIYKALMSLRFYDENEISVKDFKLIKEEGLIYPVFVELDDEAKRIWQKFMSIINDNSLERWEKKVKLLEIKTDLDSYIVNVRVRKGDTGIFELLLEKNLGYIPFDRVKNFYDIETGIKNGIHLEAVVF